MIDLPALREDLTTVLAPVAQVFDHLPERVNPPVLLIEPDDPWITDENSSGTVTFGSVRVRFVVFVVVRAGTARKQTADLDALTTKTLAALIDSEQWYVEDTRQPFTVTIAGQPWFATYITIYANTTL